MAGGTLTCSECGWSTGYTNRRRISDTYEALFVKTAPGTMEQCFDRGFFAVIGLSRRDPLHGTLQMRCHRCMTDYEKTVVHNYCVHQTHAPYRTGGKHHD